MSNIKDLLSGGAKKQTTQNAGVIPDHLLALEAKLQADDKVRAIMSRVQDSISRQVISLDSVMNMIGSLGTDPSIDQSIVDEASNVLGNNSDPIKATKFFTGLIAKRILTIADTRKQPANLFAQLGGVNTDITSNRVFMSPIALLSACAYIQPVQWTQNPFSGSFDDNGEFVVSAVTFNNIDFSSTLPMGSNTPFIGNLFIIKRKDMLKGDAKFFIRSAAGYRAGIQINEDTAVVLVLNHTTAKQFTGAITTDGTGAPTYSVDTSGTLTSIDTQYEVLFSGAGPTINVTGTNVSITQYGLPMYTAIAEAFLATMISGRLDMIAAWTLSSLTAQIKGLTNK